MLNSLIMEKDIKIENLEHISNSSNIFRQNVDFEQSESRKKGYISILEK